MNIYITRWGNYVKRTTLVNDKILRGEKRQKQIFPYDEYLYNLMGKLLQKKNSCGVRKKLLF